MDESGPCSSSEVPYVKNGGSPGTKLPIRHRRRLETNSPGRARSNKKRRCLIPASEERAQLEEHSPPPHISELPADVLVKIFSSLDLKIHRFVLPLVCRQWHDILAKPLGIWNHLDIDFAAEAAEAEEIIPGSNTKNASKVRESRVLQWVKPRAAAVKSLRLRGSAEANPPSTEVAVTGCAQRRPHDFTGNGIAKLLMTVASPLEELVIESCQDILTDITFIAMGRLPNLTVLCLKGICTVLSEQDFCAIAQLHGLQELVLDCEQPPDVEEGVEEIKWGLQGFPEGMLHLTNMTHLTLTCHYGITQLPEGLSKLNKLEVLNLDFCTLNKLPASLGKLTALTTLDVEGNLFLGDEEAAAPSMPNFPHELSGLQALRYLNLNSCGLMRIPSVVSSMTALETLDLENNSLGTPSMPFWRLDTQLTSLSRMQCLNLAQNMLMELPQLVVDFCALRILDLTNNNLMNSGIPDTLTRLSHLKAIGLKKNNLTRVPPVLGSMHSLQEIYLENNPGLEVESSLDFIAKLPNLRILMMGKQTGFWGPASMHFMADLSAKLKIRHPEKEILRISFPGHEVEALPDEAYQMLM